MGFVCSCPNREGGEGAPRIGVWERFEAHTVLVRRWVRDSEDVADERVDPPAAEQGKF